MNGPEVGGENAAPTATAQYAGRHRQTYRAGHPARGEAAAALAAAWGVSTDKLPEVVAAWGTRCRLVEFADRTVKCQKCGAISARFDEDDE